MQSQDNEGIGDLQEVVKHDIATENTGEHSNINNHASISDKDYG